MSTSVGAAYDAVAAVYAETFLHELDGDTQSLRWLDDFVAHAKGRSGPVLDLGCGPGRSVQHLESLEIPAFGVDLSMGQLDQARHAFPQLRLIQTDLTRLCHPARSVGGIVARHSIIHLDPTQLATVFTEWARVLDAGAPLFLSFFGAKTAGAHGLPFDHKVSTAYQLYPATVAKELEESGYEAVEVEAVPIAPGGRPFDHVTMLARRLSL